MRLVLTCEHAGNCIPSEYENIFKNATAELHSHRGFDPGALDLFYSLKSLASFSHFQEISRLLVEMNRSLENPELFSEFTKDLSPEAKNEILDNFYFPYRNLAEDKISEIIGAGEKVLHFSIHSFTPQLNGKSRNADIGLLFDPERLGEKQFCEKFKKELLAIKTQLNVRFNYPYLGTADGFTTSLRKKFGRNYLGIELELNQKFVSENKLEPQLKNDIFEVFSKIISEN